MPRKSINKSLPKDFEPKKKNAISLGDDSNIDNDFKPFRIGGVDTGLEFKLDGIKSTTAEFETFKETTQELNVTKIKGNRIPALDEPQLIIQNKNVTDDTTGLWFNVYSDGTGYLKSNSGQLIFEADTAISFLTGDGAGEDFVVREGTFASYLDYFKVKNTRELFLYADGTTDDYFEIDVDANGATAISTVDADAALAHLTLDPDGDLLISGADTKTDATKKIYFDGGTHTYIHESADDVLQIIVGGDTMLELNEATGTNTFDGYTHCPRGLWIDAGRTLGLDGLSGHTTITEVTDDQLLFEVGGEYLMVLVEDATTSALLSSGVYHLAPTIMKDVGGVADTPASGYGSLYVNSDVLYFKTDGGTVTNLLAGGGGTSRWSFHFGGFKSNNGSSTAYYTSAYGASYYSWSASDSSPTSVAYNRRAFWTAPADGTLTKISVDVSSNSTLDDVRFYVYKGTATEATSFSLTLIGTSDAAGIDTASKNFTIRTAVSSSNSFSAGDGLWVFYKKETDNATNTQYFTGTITGEFD